MRPPNLLRPPGLGATFTTCQQVLIRRHGYRNHDWFDKRKYSTGLESEELHNRLDDLRALTLQDPGGRIGFLPCTVPPNLIKDIYDKDAVSFSLHVIPTWTVMYQLNTIIDIQRHSYQDAAVETQRIDIGFTVTAVPRDHWAHGLHLEDNFNQLGFQDPLGLTSDDPAALYEQVGPLLLQNPAVPFASSFPDLDEKSAQSICDIGAIDGEYRSNSGRFSLVYELDNEDHPGLYMVNAVPLYRVAYLMRLKNGGMAYFDGFSLTPTHSFRIYHKNGRAYTDRERWRTSRTGFHKWGHYIKERVIEPISPPTNNEHFGNLLYDLSRNVLPNWNDPRIVQHHYPGWISQRPTVSTVHGESIRRLKSSANLDWGEMQNVTTSTEKFDAYMAQAKATLDRTKTSLPSRPVSSAPKMGRPKPSILRGPPPRRPIPGPTVRDRVEPPRPKFSIPPPKPLERPQSVRTAGQSSSANQPSTPMNQLPAIRDPLHFYKTLGINRPTEAYLLVTSQVEIDEFLKGKFHDLANALHSDKGRKDEGTNATMTDVNIARDAVKTLSARAYYYKHGKAI